MKKLGRDDVARVRRLIERAGLPVTGPALGPDEMLRLMAVDKKAAGGKLRFVLLDAIGRAELFGSVDERALREVVVAAAQ